MTTLLLNMQQLILLTHNNAHSKHNNKLLPLKMKVVCLPNNQIIFEISTAIKQLHKF